MTNNYPAKSLYYFALLVFSFFIGSSSIAQTIQTLVGTGSSGYTGDGGLYCSATVSRTAQLCTDAAGNIYFSDQSNYAVRRISTSGIITTIAGTGTAGFSGDGGPATAANIGTPLAIIVTTGGKIYFVDYDNNRVRSITGGIINTVAGTGTASSTGDGGPATSATLNGPYGLGLDASNNLYISETHGNRVRVINTSSGIINTYAGTGSGGFSGDGGPATSASLVPNCIYMDPYNNLYISDNGNHRIRMVNTSGIINTVAGNGTGSFSGDGGPATSASIYYPAGITKDAAGNLIFCDAINYRVRKVNSAGIINTIAGNGSASSYGDGGAPTAAGIDYPQDVCYNRFGQLMITDLMSSKIRIIWSNHPPVFTNAPSRNLFICTGSGTTSLNSLLSVIDSDFCQTETWTVISGAVHGSLSGFTTSAASNGDTVTPSGLGYTPTTGYSGMDSFSIRVGDGFDYDTIKIIVTIASTPGTVTISGPSNVCVSSTITLVNSAAGGAWSSNNMAVATVTTGGIVTGVTAGTAIISYYISAGCGTSLATKTITVNPIPGISATPLSPAFCSGVSTTITASGATTYTWLPGTGLSATTGSSVAAHPAVTTTYTITGTASGGCQNTLNLTVTVYPLPNISAPGASICAGYNTVLTASGAVSYTWSPATTLSNSTGASVTATPPATTLYIVHGTDANGCSNTATVNVIVNPTPSAPVSSTPLRYCLYAIAPALTASGTNLLWYSSATGGAGSTTAPVPSTGTSGTTDFYVSQTLNGCESPWSDIQVIVADPAFMGFSYDIKYGCTYDTVLFTNTSLNCFGYTWYFGDGSTVTDTNTNPVHYYQPAYVSRDFTVKLVGYNPICNDDSAMQIITLSPNPIQPVVLTGITTSDTIFYGTSVQLNATGAQIYLWEPNDGSLSNPNINNPVATPSVTTTYTVFGYNKSGCVDSAKVTIAVKYNDIDFIPSGFTPNGDGYNDLFRITNPRFGKLVDMSIYNRWGVLVYQTNDINKGWDGTLNGQPQDIGVYNYLIITSHTDGANKIYKGTITLIR